MEVIDSVNDGIHEQTPVKASNNALHVDSSPAIVAVTPSDVTTYDPPLLGVRVGTTAGNVKVVSNGATVTIPGVAVAETIPGKITKVFSTDTTAAGITGWQRIT